MLRRAVGKQDLHVQEALGIRRAIGEIMIAGEKLAGGALPVRVAQVARAVHHQAGVGRDLADDRLVARLGVRPAALHRDARREGPAPRCRRHRQEALGVGRVLGEQQGVGARVVVLPA